MTTDPRVAMAEGRTASVGAANPYSGQGILAGAWRRGYQTMLAKMVEDLDARQAGK